MKFVRSGLLTAICFAGPVSMAAPQLEEVIVTAQKKSESLQDTPISLAVFGSEDLEAQGITGLGDMLSKVPNLSIDRHPTSGTTLRLYIRGIGTNDSSITLDPAVGVYQNGVYISRATGLAMDLADLERIEVLRGPQGTLYGRNSTGGTINLITQKPALDERFAYIKASAASRQKASIKAVWNQPLGDSLAIKLAALGSRSDGFIDNTGPGEDFGDRSAEGYRMDLSWQPGDRWDVLFSADRSKLDFVNYLPQSERPSTNDGSNADQVRAGANANSRHEVGRVDELATTAPHRSSPNTIGGWAIDVKVALDWADVRSITAFRTLETENYIDLGGGAGSDDYRLDTGFYAFRNLSGGSLPETAPVLEHEQWSQEFQLLFSALDDSLESILGVFWFDESAEEDNRPEHHVLSGQIGGANSPTYLVSTQSQYIALDATAWAVFGQFTYTPDWHDQRWHFTLGARHSEDKKTSRKFLMTRALIDSQANLTSVELRANAFDQMGEKRFRDDSFSFTVEFDLNERSNLYAKVAEAYKGGGFNIREPDPEFYAAGFDEENVLTYEVGIKSEWFERRLRLNADVFYSLSDNTQLSFALGGANETRVLNVGESVLQGFELDTTYLVSESITATLNYAWLDGEITSAKDADGVERKDDFVLGNAPEHTANLNLNWRIAQGNWGLLESTFTASYTAEKAAAATRSAFERHGGIDAYSLINLRFAWRDIPLGGRALGDIALWSKNLLDEEYAVTVLGVLPHSNRAVFWGEPRSAGMDFKLSF